MAQWPRQPRSGNSANLAQRYSSGSKHYIQLKNSSGTWVNSFYVSTSSRADSVVTRLNNIFNNYPGADLDFITPNYENGFYVVVWSGVQWSQSQSYSTTTTNQGTTYENLYAGCYNTSKSYAYSSRSNVQIIATVTADDTSAYGVSAWELALTWANAIHATVNGWNCTKDSTGGLSICKRLYPSTNNSYKQLQRLFFGKGGNVLWCGRIAAQLCNCEWKHLSYLRPDRCAAKQYDMVSKYVDQNNI